MPELSRFEGLIIRMFYDDVREHHKPHVHVVCGEYEASVGLDGEVLDGVLPVKKLAILKAWLIMREDELYAAWNSAVKNVPFGKIAPLN